MFCNSKQTFYLCIRIKQAMRIITYKAIDQYTVLQTDAKVALDEWYIKTEQSQWQCFADVRQTFNSVDNVGNKRYVFNIKGNTFRLIALILFAPKIVYIRFIGTHTEYDKIKDCSII
jgi:mRNA interferase HigB